MSFNDTWQGQFTEAGATGAPDDRLEGNASGNMGGPPWISWNAGFQVTR
jgi:hypothetical protein